jgi:hypothetical protein
MAEPPLRGVLRRPRAFFGDQWLRGLLALDRRAAIESHAERSTRVSAARCDDQLFEFQKAKARQPRAPGALQNQIRISQAALLNH